MYLVRRVCKTKPGQAWAVAGYLAKICEAYEENGRDKARIYIEGQGLPGTPNRVYAEWTQDSHRAQLVLEGSPDRSRVQSQGCRNCWTSTCWKSLRSLPPKSWWNGAWPSSSVARQYHQGRFSAERNREARIAWRSPCLCFSL